ncbi:MAG: ComEC/Rec2 family competence protein [Oscillospiraceae bacterium]|jgi:competence protein ComEC
MKRGILQAFATLLLIAAMIGLIYGLELMDRPPYDPNLNIAFVGTANDADCIVLWQENFAMMIDTGEAGDAQTILSFLEEHKIETLNYLVLTHPDKDHIGSAADIVRALKVDAVIQPFYQKENDTHRFLQARLNQSRVKVVVPSRILHYTVHDMEIYIYPPLEKNYNENNNYSLAVYVEHGDVSMLFPGDAQSKRIGELMQVEWNPVDLYKLPHHGRHHSRSGELFSLLSPTYTVVTAKEASPDLAEMGNEMGTQWFFSVEQTVLFHSDGKTIQWVS